jgi:hypothetical protein
VIYRYLMEKVVAAIWLSLEKRPFFRNLLSRTLGGNSPGSIKGVRVEFYLDLERRLSASASNQSVTGSPDPSPRSNSYSKRASGFRLRRIPFPLIRNVDGV